MSIETVSTVVRNKNKGHYFRSKNKPENDMTYQDIYNYICQNRKEMKIYYPLCHTYGPTVVEESISKRWTNMQEATG